MYERIKHALAEPATAVRRLARAEDECGFTLIELLVVVIIIGILAAIAIPIYLGVQGSSKDSQVESDATNLKIAVVAYYADNTATAAPAIDSAGVTALSKYGATQSPQSVSFAYSGSQTWPKFCIAATGKTSTVWYVTDSLGATKIKPSVC